MNTNLNDRKIWGLGKRTDLPESYTLENLYVRTNYKTTAVNEIILKIQIRTQNLLKANILHKVYLI